MTGLELVELAADLASFGAGRRLDDNAQMMLRYANGARGALWASQVAPGNENGLMLRVYGTKGGLQWRQDNPNQMLWSPFEKATRIITRGGPESGNAAATVKAARTGKKPPKGVHFPTIDDGVKGLAFIEAAVKSSKANGRWVKP